jgi:hypothetical protein
MPNSNDPTPAIRANIHQLTELLRAAETCLDVDSDVVRAVRAALVIDTLKRVEHEGFSAAIVGWAARRLRQLPGGRP